MKRDAEKGSVSPPPIRRKLESTTTKKAVAGFFTPASKKSPDRTHWRVVDGTLLLGRYRPYEPSGSDPQPVKRRKIAAFDFDSTLISTSSGNIFAKDASDWKWWHISVPSTLKQLYADGYSISILSNQGSIGLKSDPKSIKGDPKSLSNFKSKVSAVFNQLDIPIILLAASARDRYRKPRTGMWNELLEELDLDNSEGADLGASFFVGDAGGRAARSGAKADHSCSDRNLAANVGIEFKTPEEFFLHEAVLPFTRDFEPRNYLNPSLTTSLDASPPVIEKKNPLDIVMFCGSPASGKSTFYRKHLQPLGYERVNQDTLKTRDKCVKVASELLLEGTSVAVDNTNADRETRMVWVQLAQHFSIPIRCVHFTASAKLCQHNDAVRAIAGNRFNPEKRVMLPHTAFSSFASRFKQPQVDEGFQDVVPVGFQFHGDDEQRKIWSRYWI
ncbi:MAG: hypothetical protein L6R38_008370 [Xanthoria sp. 2 TBL-2021]|nr:MAG: hypothetical protein L6R38_008370 [Xanthoria sp. 2 TBL-2021]